MPLNSGPAGIAPRIETFYCEASAIGRGQVVAMTAAGRATNAGATGASVFILGVAADYVPAGTAGAETRKVNVYTDQAQRFIAQADDASMITLTNQLLQHCVLTGNATVNTTTGDCQGELDASSHTSVPSTTIPYKVFGPYLGVDNDPALTKGKFIVGIIPAVHLYGTKVDTI